MDKKDGKAILYINKPDAIMLTEQAVEELASLAGRLVDVSDPDAPEITDWKTAQRGQFYRPTSAVTKDWAIPGVRP